MFKKIILSLLILAMITNVSAIAADNPRVRVDGEFVYIPADDQLPVIVDGRTLVPLRAVMETLGFNVHWEPYPANQVSLTSATIEGLQILVTIGRDTMRIYDWVPGVRFGYEDVPLDVPAQIINNRTMVPVRAISEATGFTVDWDNDNRIVDVWTTAELEISANPNHNIAIHIPFLYTQSSIALPMDRPQTDIERQEWIAEYWGMGGPSGFELEVIRLTNEQRILHGLSVMQIDVMFMLPARFYAQTLATVGRLAHDIGPYGSSANVVRFFDPNSIGRRNGMSGRWTPQDVVDGWMNSPGHRDNILHPANTRVGFGSQLTDTGGVFHYMVLSGGEVQQPFDN